MMGHGMMGMMRQGTMPPEMTQQMTDIMQKLTDLQKQLAEMQAKTEQQ